MSGLKLWLSAFNRYNKGLLATQLGSKQYFSSTRLRSTRMEGKERQDGGTREKREAVKKPNPGKTGNRRLRGHPRDQEDVRISKTMSWLLRHGAKSEGLYMRQDGYVRVNDMLALPKLQGLDMTKLEELVKSDAKSRYNLLFEAPSESSEGEWWIRANQGHSLKDVDLELTVITGPSQVPMAVHGTNAVAWSIIEREGLSPMKRTHIHMAQTIEKAKGANPGMRSSSSIIIHIDLEKALKAGIKFYVSDNGVVLSKGDESGYLRPEFFKKVTKLDGTPLKGWAEGDLAHKEREVGEVGPLRDVMKEEIDAVKVEEALVSLKV